MHAPDQTQASPQVRNINENITNNSLSNIFENQSQFKSYRQKYHRSRRQKTVLMVNVDAPDQTKAIPLADGTIPLLCNDS